MHKVSTSVVDNILLKIGKEELEQMTAEAKILAIEDVVQILTSDDDHPLRWRLLKVSDPNSADPKGELEKLLRIELGKIFDVLGHERFRASDPVLLEQTIFSAVERGHSMDMVLDILQTGTMLAYSHPASSERMERVMQEIADISSQALSGTLESKAPSSSLH